MKGNLKLLIGEDVTSACWGGPLYPNASTKAGPNYSPQQGVGHDPCNTTLLCAENGCLFDVTADPSERHDLASDPQFEKPLAEMKSELRAANVHYFHPKRGSYSPLACDAARRYGGYWGPFVDVSNETVLKTDDAAGHHIQRVPKTPNVLFVVVDDLRPSLGAYNFTLAHTPNLDKLASEGLTFARAYVQYAYCAPSRNSFMSGRRPDTTMAWEFNDHFRETGPGTANGADWQSLPQYFKTHGYVTLGSGKLCE
jgi:arylsulfatase A-like enzyme